MAIVYVGTSLLLKRMQYDHYIRKVFRALITLSIAIILISFIIGAWVGMAIGFIGLSMLVGVLIGGLMMYLINHIWGVNK